MIFFFNSLCNHCQYHPCSFFVLHSCEMPKSSLSDSWMHLLLSCGPYCAARGGRAADGPSLSLINISQMQLIKLLLFFLESGGTRFIILSVVQIVPLQMKFMMMYIVTYTRVWQEKHSVCSTEKPNNNYFCFKCFPHLCSERKVPTLQGVSFQNNSSFQDITFL